MTGRDLDARVARAAGYTVITMAYALGKYDGWILKDPSGQFAATPQRTEAAAWEKAPHFSSDLAAAITLHDAAMRLKGYAAFDVHFDPVRAYWYAAFGADMDHLEEDEDLWQEAETFQHESSVETG